MLSAFDFAGLDEAVTEIEVPRPVVTRHVARGQLGGARQTAHSVDDEIERTPSATPALMFGRSTRLSTARSSCDWPTTGDAVAESEAQQGRSSRGHRVRRGQEAPDGLEAKDTRRRGTRILRVYLNTRLAAMTCTSLASWTWLTHSVGAARPLAYP